MNFIFSLILGILPEILYFTLFLINTKDIKNKKLKLFSLIAMVYFICIVIGKYKLIYYVSFIFLIYIVLKILYKEKAQIIDIFVISAAYIYVCLISFICSRFINNNYTLYYIMLIINRILLFIPFLFKSKFHVLYKKYCSLWNRNYNKKQPIKSITLRNISLIILNSFIFLLNIATIYVINTFNK